MHVRCFLRSSTVALLAIAVPAPAAGGDGPFFVTYSHVMEAPTDLEVSLTATARNSSGLTGSTLVEFEYGLSARWTTSIYLDVGLDRKTGLTGFRWENRIRPFMREHWINPVFYAEFVDVSGSDQAFLDVTGRLPTAREQVEKAHDREVEGRLILGSQFHGWTLAENVVVSHPLSAGATEFGYAIGARRPVVVGARQERCRLCGENFELGWELYGGLGDQDHPGLRATGHYATGNAAWTGIQNRVSISVGAGLTSNSRGLILRVGLAHEIDDFGRSVHNLLTAALHRF
jgi:hypothetical protein